MAIYTSYFGNLRNLPKDMVPIAIYGKSPNWYTGKEYKVLAPKYEFFMEWKKNHDNDYYRKCYKEQVLDQLDPREVVKDLLLLACNFKGLNYMPDIVLVCYEVPEEFCHRHEVSKWFRDNHIEVSEFIPHNRRVKYDA